MLENIKTEIASYYDHYVYLADMIEVYQHLDKVLSTVQKESIGINFLKITPAATIDSMMMNLSRLFDDDKKSKSIPQLIDKCRNHSHLLDDKSSFKKELDEFKDAIKTDECLSSAVEIIKMRRDKLFAHNNEKFFNEPNKDDSYLAMYKIWMLRDFIKKVLLFFGKSFEVNFTKNIIYNSDLNVLQKNGGTHHT